MLDVHWRKASEYIEKEVFRSSFETRCWIL
jgi:hypothetical protein